MRSMPGMLAFCPMLTLPRATPPAPTPTQPPTTPHHPLTLPLHALPGLAPLAVPLHPHQALALAAHGEDAVAVVALDRLKLGQRLLQQAGQALPHALLLRHSMAGPPAQHSGLSIDAGCMPAGMAAAGGNLCRKGKRLEQLLQLGKAEHGAGRSKSAPSPPAALQRPCGGWRGSPG